MEVLAEDKCVVPSFLLWWAARYLYGPVAFAAIRDMVPAIDFVALRFLRDTARASRAIAYGAFTKARTFRLLII